MYSSVVEQGDKDNGTVINGEHLSEVVDQQVLVRSGDVVLFEHVTDCVIDHVYR